MDKISTPFIADLLAFLLFLAVIYVFLYSIVIRIYSPSGKIVITPIPIQKPIKQVQSKSNSTNFIDIYSNSLTQNNLYNDSGVDLVDISVILILSPKPNPEYICKNSKNVQTILEEILDYFQNLILENGPIKSYEVKIAFNTESLQDLSTETNDDAYQNEYRNLKEFILRNREFSFLHITTELYDAAWILSCLKTRGRLIFVHSPYENVPFNIISKYLQKSESGNDFLLLGAWKDRSPEEMVLQTNLSLLLNSFHDYLFSFLDINPRIYHHCFSFMLTRNLAKTLVLNLSLSEPASFFEMIVLSDILNCPIQCVKLDQVDDVTLVKPSSRKLIELLSMLIILFTRFSKICRIPIVRSHSKQ